MVEPEDAEGLAAALNAVLTDAQTRAEMRARGLARARTFSWQESARRTLNSYRRAAAAGGGEQRV
jgi:glycosyltransferase involved in cell wall biosynthesis